MKIVKKGKAVAKAPPWWIGLIITCDSCKSKIKLEELDHLGPLTITQERRIGGKRTIEFICPLEGCRAEISWSQPGTDLEKVV